MCSPVQSSWLSSSFKSTRFVSFVYATYKNNCYLNLFAILPKAIVHLHSRLQSLHGDVPAVNKTMDNATHGELLCSRYVPNILDACEEGSLNVFVNSVQIILHDAET